jgi:hypothetical protein
MLLQLSTGIVARVRRDAYWYCVWHITYCIKLRSNKAIAIRVIGGWGPINLWDVEE